MTVQDVDVIGNVWFLSARSSTLNKDINRNPRVQLLFANTGDSEYLNLLGFATIHDSKDFREKYWTPIAKAWFPGGVNDPELTIIRVQPKEGHYWDTVYGKAVTLLMVAIGAVTGKATDVAVQGDVKP
ncbi:MAG: ral stress protein [Verrucomicrobia bacterium]|nr:ral stress protein [Verrucomicrobiota bacterium]